MTKQQTIDLLARRFPEADLDQLRRFVDSRMGLISGWDGDTFDTDDLEAMAAAWLVGPDGPATC
jgi:hypothetical protein